MAFADVRAGGAHFGAQRLQVQHFFGRHLVGHHQQHAVTLQAADQGQAQARVAGRRFDDGAARLQPAIFLGCGYHGQADPVLDRAAGVL